MHKSNRVPFQPTRSKVLLVDDDELFRSALSMLLAEKGFEVVEASSVRSALASMSQGDFDGLVSDLHLPSPGDGLSVATMMHHLHPKAINIILSANPEMKTAAADIIHQVDEVLVKNLPIEKLVSTIVSRLKLGAAPPTEIHGVASILERETESTIQEWLNSVDLAPTVKMVPLFDVERCEHLYPLIRDILLRLRNPSLISQRALNSSAAVGYGLRRSRQGYTAPMLVEESRMLQASIFQTLQNNLHEVDSTALLISIIAIADEIHSQLAQAIASFIDGAQSRPQSGKVEDLSPVA